MHKHRVMLELMMEKAIEREKSSESQCARYSLEKRGIIAAMYNARTIRRRRRRNGDYIDDRRDVMGGG